MGRKRRKFTDNFKAQVALEALRADRTTQEIAAKHNVLPTQVSTWKKQTFEGDDVLVVFEKAMGKRVVAHAPSGVFGRIELG